MGGPDEIPRKILVCLFDGSGGSTPQTRSSKEEPNTDDREFIKGDGEPLSDPSYHPTDEESDWCSGLESPFEETKIDKPIPGGAWINDADGDAVWVPEDIGGGGPGGDPFAGIFGHGGGPGAAHTPKRKKGKKQSKKEKKKAAKHDVSAGPSTGDGDDEASTAGADGAGGGPPGGSSSSSSDGEGSDSGDASEDGGSSEGGDSNEGDDSSDGGSSSEELARDDSFGTFY